MRAVIFGGGDIKNYERVKNYLSPNDCILCADGGYRHAEIMGVKPNILIGDFDSIKEMPEDIKTERYPVKKDMTDSQLALQRASEMGAEEILLFGMTGDRADHTLANFLLLLNYKNAVIIDDNNEVRSLDNTCPLKISGNIGQTLSIIPVNGDLEGVTTKGLEYPLNNGTLKMGDSKGISNVMTEKEAVIECRRGIALVIKVMKV